MDIKVQQEELGPQSTHEKGIENNYPHCLGKTYLIHPNSQQLPYLDLLLVWVTWRPLSPKAHPSHTTPCVRVQLQGAGCS